MPFDPDKIEGIIWDLDNTLYRFTDEFKHHCNIAAAKTAQELGIKLSYDDSFKLAQKSELENGYSLHGYITHHGFSYESMHIPYHDNIDETIIEIIEDVAPKLRHLDIPQTILTNASRGWAHRVLKKIGLEGFFDDAVITAVEDVGFKAKSESRAGFERALNTLNLVPEKVIMVDDLDRNLIIPHEMGIQTVYMHYEDPIGDLPHYIDVQFENILEFIKTVRN